MFAYLYEMGYDVEELLNFDLESLRAAYDEFNQE